MMQAGEYAKKMKSVAKGLLKCSAGNSLALFYRISFPSSSIDILL